MKALHVFPIFGDDLTNGSEYVEFMLTRGLVKLGVEVEVFATCAARVHHRSAFALDWERDFSPGPAWVDRIPVRRFPVTFSLPRGIGHAVSQLIVRRWQREEERYGTPPKGSDAAVESYCARALSRPIAYDYLALLGRGPHPLGLVAAAIRRLRRCDLVLAGFTPFATMWYMTVIARRLGKPVVLLPLFHPQDLYHHFQVFYRCFARADALLAQTPYSTALFKRFLPTSNPVQVGVGVDERELADPSVSGERFRARYGVGDAKIVLFVGRKEHHKRYDLAVQAVDHLADDRVKLVMIGADIDGRPLTSARVVSCGPIPRADLLDAYDACDVFVLPSEHESFGIVFLEAWMRRKPVLGNAACRPVASIIDDGTDGFLCRDGAEFAARIRQLLDHPAEARALGEAGYRKTVARFTWDAVTRRVYDLYADLLARRTPG